MMVLIVLFVEQSSSAATTGTSKADSECPVCLRIMRAIKDLSKSQSIPMANALKKYCGMQSLEVEDEKFCYNTDTFKKDIDRLLGLNADEFRICKKVKSINPDFCQVKVATKKEEFSISQNSKRGIIYI